MQQPSYERTLNELQSLKKQLNTEKLSHESTLNQLQASHQMNTELQQIIKNQTETINGLKKELGEKILKLENCGNIYEQQLIDMKNLIESKDEELKRIRKSLSITDYDMIRLRILNEVELVHDEEIQALKQEITRLDTLGNQYKLQNGIHKDKYENLKSEIERKELQHSLEIEKREKQYSKELNKMFNQLQQEKLQKRQLQRSIQALSKKQKNITERYEKQISNLTIEKATNQNHRVSYSEDEQFIKKRMRNMEDEHAKKEQEWGLNRKKMTKENQILKNKVNEMERELNEKSYTEQKLKMKLKEKQDQKSEMQRIYERRLRQQKEDYEDENKKWEKQLSRERTQRTQKEKYSYDKENSNVEINRKKLEVRQLTQRNQLLEREILRLEQELRKLKEDKRPPSRVGKEKDDYKEKLKEANKIIVNLLKEKAIMKEQKPQFTQLK